MAKLVSKTYGDALFNLGEDLGKIDDLYEEALNLQSALSDNPEFKTLMDHPKIVKEDKKKIIEETFSKDFSKEIVGFLLIILEKNRFNEIDSILEYFILKVKEYKGIGVVYITSASELNDVQKAKVEKRLLETTKYNSLECNYNVEKDMIAGLKIRIGDRVIDNTVKTKIDEMSKNLYNIKLG